MADEKHDPGSHGSGASPLSQPAHALPYEAVLDELQTKVDDGLTTEEANARLKKYGPNKLDEGEGVSVLDILIRQIANAMMLVKGPTFFTLPLSYEGSQNLIQFCNRC